jgi:isocitrate dehydrogenase
MGMIRAGMLMLEYFGWNEPVALIDKALEKSIAQKKVTQDIARLMGCEAIGTKEFSDAVISNL